MSDPTEPPGDDREQPPPPPPPPPPSGGSYEPPSGGGYQPPPPPPGQPPPGPGGYQPPPPPGGGQPYGQPQHGQPQYGYQAPQPVTGTVPNYLPHAITATVLGLFCCSGIGAIPGIVGIVYSTQVRSKEQMGDLAGAQQASKNARTWSWVGIGLGILAAIVIIGLIALGVIFGEASTTNDFQDF